MNTIFGQGRKTIIPHAVKYLLWNWNPYVSFPSQAWFSIGTERQIPARGHL